MATTVTTNFDTRLVVYHRDGSGQQVGLFSKYVDHPHPVSGKKITPWEWNKRLWHHKDGDNYRYIPRPLEPILTNVPEEYFQSGTGEGFDLQVVEIIADNTSGIPQWHPKVEHGWAYFNSDEQYVYSDGLAQENFDSADNDASGLNMLTCSARVKPGPPIYVRQFEYGKWDSSVTTKYDLQLVSGFSTKFLPDGTELPLYDSFGNLQYGNIDHNKEEFVVTGINNGYYVLQTNRNYQEEVGVSVSSASDLDLCDFLGQVQNPDKDIFRTKYFPVDRTADVNIYTYDVNNKAAYTTWTVVEEKAGYVDDGSLDGGNKCYFDYDIGQVRFASKNWPGANTPTEGDLVVAHYTTTLQASYEAHGSPDQKHFTTANVHPSTSGKSKGYITLYKGDLVPANITLELDLPGSNSRKGPLNAGGGFAVARAFVTTADGLPVPNASVEFGWDINANAKVGGWQSASGDEVTLSTNSNGIATALYFAPIKLDDGLREVLNAGTISGSQTIFNLTKLQPIPNVSNIYLYRIKYDDPTLGDVNWNNEWQQFFAELGLVDSTENRNAEARRRAIFYTMTSVPSVPQSETAGGPGRWTIVAMADSSTSGINPHTGSSPALLPMTASSISKTANGYTIAFDSTSLPDYDTDGAYAAAGDTKAILQASVLNPRTGSRIYSNKVTVQITIPDSMSGTYIVDDLSTVPSDLASLNLSLNDIVPFGWRLPSTSASIAAAINAVTFIDINMCAVKDIGGKPGIAIIAPISDSTTDSGGTKYKYTWDAANYYLRIWDNTNTLLYEGYWDPSDLTAAPTEVTNDGTFVVLGSPQPGGGYKNQPSTGSLTNPNNAVRLRYSLDQDDVSNFVEYKLS